MLIDRVKMQVTSSGTGPFVLGDAVAAFRGKDVLTDGQTYSYVVEQDDRYEVGTCTYLAATGMLVRTPSISSNGNNVVSFAAGAEVSFTALAADFVSVAAVGSIPTGQWAR